MRKVSAFSLFPSKRKKKVLTCRRRNGQPRHVFRPHPDPRTPQKARYGGHGLGDAKSQQPRLARARRRHIRRVEAQRPQESGGERDLVGAEGEQRGAPPDRPREGRGRRCIIFFCVLEPGVLPEGRERRRERRRGRDGDRCCCRFFLFFCLFRFSSFRCFFPVPRRLLPGLIPAPAARPAPASLQQELS